jgi:hypothetical protein
MATTKTPVWRVSAKLAKIIRPTVIASGSIRLC